MGDYALIDDYAVIDPATGERLATFPQASQADIDTAIDAAASACESWGRASSPAERAALIRRVAELHGERREYLAAAIGREMGKPMEEALGEVDFCREIYEFYADNAARLLGDEQVPLRQGGGTAVIRRSPMGALLGIMPWNFPYYQVARFAAPNLAIGNTIVLKHAPQCPESAAALHEIFAEAGFPRGAYVAVNATVNQVAEMIADPRIAGVSLTGSERAGAAVAEIAGRNLKKVVLELGGSDPFVLLSTDDLDAVVEAAVAARLDNVGQVCNAPKRFIVAERALRGLPRPVHHLDARRGRWRRADVVGPRRRRAPGAGRTAPWSRAPFCTPPGSARAPSSRPGCLPGSLRTRTCSPRNSSGRSPSSSGSPRRPRPSSWPTTRRTAWAPICSPLTRSRRSAWRTRSTPAWCSSTASCSTRQSFRSEA